MRVLLTNLEPELHVFCFFFFKLFYMLEIPVIFICI